MKVITVIHCWSAPRSRSTALLYSFEARGTGTVAIDEPLYREWLIQKGDSVARPYLREMIEGVPPSRKSSTEGKVEEDDDDDDEEEEEEEPEQWKRELLSLQERIEIGSQQLDSGGVIFCKHMAKHSFLYDFDKEWQLESEDVELIHRHLLLIRDPVAVLSSWGSSGDVHGDNPTSDEIGILPLLAIYTKLESRMDGKAPVVLESDELVSDPEGTLFHICDRLSIPFNTSMLSWNKGKHKCDGPWAKVRVSFW
jgi:hypothetical protein